MPEQKIHTGLGKMYITSVKRDEFPPIELCNITHNVDTNEQVDRHHSDGKGWEMTVTVRLSATESKVIRHLLSEGRMPRKEKKRRKNRVFRNAKRMIGIAIAMWQNELYAYMITAGMMFPERLQPDGHGNTILALNPNEQKVVKTTLCYIKSNGTKIIQRNMDIVKEMKREIIRSGIVNIP